jgi:hypothetical protein
MGCPHPVAFVPCPDMFTPYSVAFFSCSDKSLPPLSRCPFLDYFLSSPSSARSPSCSDVSALSMALPCGGLSPLLTATRAPSCARCLALKRIEFCSGGFLSPASRLDAGGALGHGRRSTHNRQHSPSFVRANARGYGVLHISVGIHNRASKPESVMGH